LVVILLCALLVRGAAGLWLDPPVGSDDKEYKELAVSLAHGGGYVLEGRPTAYRTPGYPLFISGVYLLFGESDRALRLVQALLDVGACALLYLLGRRLRSGPVGLVAAGIFALFPSQVLYTSEIMSETVFTFLLLLVAWLATSASAGRAWTDLLVGFLIGILILVRSTAAVLPIVVILACRRPKTPLLRTLGSSAIVALTALVVTTPWLYRNYATFGRVSLSSNVGINLWIGNHEGANGSFTFPPTGNPLHSLDDDYLRSDTGVSRALRHMAEHTGAYPVLLAKKWAHFLAADYWLALSIDPIPGARQYPNAATLFSRIDPWLLALVQVPFMLVLVAGMWGLVCWKDPVNPTLTFSRAIILSWLGIHLLFFAVARHRFPIVPFLMLGAAYLWMERHDLWARCSRSQKVVAAALTLVILAGWAAEAFTLRAGVLPYP
jgi:4-amino-4-deoxy-L-arabinose transferase-like glycosyltransferase